MPGRYRKVDWFHRISAEEVEAVEAGRHLHQLAEILEGARTPSAVEIGDVGRAGNHRGDDPIASQGYVAFGNPAVKREFTGDRRDCLENESAVEAHTHGGIVDVGACLAIELPGIPAQDLHPEFLKDIERGIVDVFQLVRRKNIERRKRIAHLAPGELGKCCRA